MIFVLVSPPFLIARYHRFSALGVQFVSPFSTSLISPLTPPILQDSSGSSSGGSQSRASTLSRSKEEIEASRLRKKTRNRTRRFEIDGVMMTSTTKKVFYGDDDTPLVDEHALRKAELRDLKLLQKQEQKQIRELHEKVGKEPGKDGGFVFRRRQSVHNLA